MNQFIRVLDTMDLVEYIGGLPPVHIERLYDHGPCTCLAVFRSLPLLEKQYVYRMLFCSDGIPRALLMVSC